MSRKPFCGRRYREIRRAGSSSTHGRQASGTIPSIAIQGCSEMAPRPMRPAPTITIKAIARQGGRAEGGGGSGARGLPVIGVP